jgi:hypothetical protein
MVPVRQKTWIQVTRDVAGMGTPPFADTCMMAPPAPLLNRMVPLLLQVAPRAVPPAFATVRMAPFEISIRLSRPSRISRNPRDRPSGDQNSSAAATVPGKSRAVSESRSCTTSPSSELNAAWCLSCESARNLLSWAKICALSLGNAIASIGPSSGALQFGVYILNGAVADVHHNRISEGLCGSLPTLTCAAQRSEGVTLRVPGDGTVVRENIISEAQAGIFVNGANDLKILDNEISNIYGYDGITIQGTAAGFFTNSIVRGNRIYGMEGITDPNTGACGIFEFPNTGVFSGNEFSDNTVNDAFCGASLNPPDSVRSGEYFNVLYQVLNSTNPSPLPVEP